jgi:hypothetical protein
MWPRRTDPPESPREREIALVAAGLSATAGVILIVGVSVDWYRHTFLCETFGCAVVRNGWQSLGAASVVLVVPACAGALSLGAVLAGCEHRAISAGAVVCALAAGLLILYRIAVSPDAAAVHSARLAGPFIALFGALALAGASSIAALGDRFFDRGAEPRIAAAAIAGCGAVIIASLYLGWIRRSAPPTAIVLNGAAGTQNAWQTMPTAAVLVLLGALAIMVAAALAAIIEWRASLIVLGFGGWLVAAIAVVATPLSVEVTGPLGTRPAIAAYEPGYYVCLGAAAVIAVAGVGAAVAERSRFSRYSSR